MAASATSLVDKLDINDAKAKKILKLGIEHGAYDQEEVPDNKKARLEGAREVLEYCIDAWISDGIRPDDEDEEVATAAEAVMELFELAGIEVDEDDGELSIEGDEEDDDADDDDDNDDDDSEGDEEPFNPDDYFEDGYTELSAATKVKALKELDLSDEDTVAIVTGIHEWESAQDKPATRVLTWIEEQDEIEIGEGGGEPEDDDDDDDGETPEAESDEPWDGYDKATAVDIKKALNEQVADEDEPLTVEQVEYVLQYEEAKERPRKRVVDHCKALIEQLGAEPEPAPKKKALGKKAKSAAPEPETEVVENGSFTLNGDEVDVHELFGALVSALDEGATAFEISAE